MGTWIGCSSGIRRLLYLGGATTFFCLVALISYLFAQQFGVSAPGGKQSQTSRESADRSAGQKNGGGTTGQGVALESEENDTQPHLNLIYGYSEKKQEITALILEIWNQPLGTLTYLTIPADTGYTISKELYQRFSAAYPEAPQMMRLSGLYRYFEGEDRFLYGCAAAGELLGVKLQSYTALPAQKLKEYFKKNKKGVWKLKKEFRTELETWQEHPWEEQEIFLEETITSLYDSMNTNQSLQERIADLNDYQKISLKKVVYEKLPGIEQNAGYQADLEAVRQQTRSY